MNVEDSLLYYGNTKADIKYNSPRNIIRAIVKVGFQSKRNDELNLKKGDEIIVLERKSNCWWKGDNGLKTGWFPYSHVEVKPLNILAIARFSYQSVLEGEMDLKKGDEIVVIEKAPSGWCRGKSGTEIGWFPSNCTEEKQDHNWLNAAVAVATAALPAEKPKEKHFLFGVIALYSCTADHHEELYFEKGSRMDIIATDKLSDNGWWEARKADGSTGLVPKNYLQAVNNAKPVFEITNACPGPLLSMTPSKSVPVLSRHWTVVNDTEMKKSLYQSKTGAKETLSTPPGYPLHQTRETPGVTFYDKPQVKQFTSTGGQADFDNGLELLVPPNAVTPGSTVGIEVQASFAPADTFLLPEGIQSASPSYLISSEGSDLNGEITLSMEHHVKVSTKEVNDLLFLQAESSPKISDSRSVYHYQVMSEAKSQFPVGENKGKLSVKKWSNKRFIKIGRKIKNFFQVSDKHDANQPDPPKSPAPDPNLYTVRVYRSPLDTTGDRIVIIGVCLYGRLYAKLLEVFDKEVIPREYPEVSSKSVDRTTLGSLSFVEMAAELYVQPVEGWSIETDREQIARSEVNQPEMANFKPEDLHDYPPRIICRFFAEEKAPRRTTCTISLSGLTPEVKVHVPLRTLVHKTVNTSKLQEATKRLRSTAFQVSGTQLGLTVHSIVSLMEKMTAALRSTSLTDLAPHTDSIRTEVASVINEATRVAEECCTRQTIHENIKASLTKLEPLSHQLQHVARVKLKHSQEHSEETAALVDLVESGASLLMTVDCLLKDMQTLIGLSGNSGHNILKLKCEKIIESLSQEPKEAALRLLSAGFINDFILEKTNELNETKREKATRLYTAVLGLLKHNAHKYQDFVATLKASPLHKDLVKELSSNQSLSVI